MERTQDTSCNCGRKATSRSQRFCVQATIEKNSHCPCVLNKSKCNSKCKCLKCANREEKKEELSCRCGESSRKKSQLEGVETKYCTNVTGKRQSKCGCYKKGQPCSRLCACYLCGNEYGQREVDSDSGDVRRKRKMTSSPPSLKRKRTTTFLKTIMGSKCNTDSGPRRKPAYLTQLSRFFMQLAYLDPAKTLQLIQFCHKESVYY